MLDDKQFSIIFLRSVTESLRKGSVTLCLLRHSEGNKNGMFLGKKMFIKCHNNITNIKIVTDYKCRD